jgi:hypothetical protein
MFSNQTNAQRNKKYPEIEKTLGHYFQGYLGADGEVLLKAFHQDARLFSIEDGKLSKTEMTDWLKNLGERKEKGDIRKADVGVLGIDVTGDSAVAKVKLTFPKFSFVDYLSLLKIDGNWIVINKIYSVLENS